MSRRGFIKRLVPAGLVTGFLALAMLLPAGTLGAIFASYGYSFGGNLHSGPSANPPSGSSTTVFVAGADDAVWTGTITNPGNGFAGWTSVLGKILNRPGSIVNSSTSQEVYARGTDS